ncbi:MAG: hypothetical protein IKP74_05325, partial [Clostridia bacterium]|nr:hypothetical protein [Clostridia bacterium]
MKRILSVLLLCAMILPLAACGGTVGVSTDAETQPSTTVALGPEVTIYGNGVVPVMISSASIISSARDTMMIIRGTLRAKLGETPRMAADVATEKNPVEIVFGDTGREISARAKALLPEQEGDEAAYAILFDEDGAAIVWNHPFAADVGMKYFSENYLTADVLSIPSGTRYVSNFSITAYEEEQRRAAEEKAEREERERYERVEQQFATRFNVITDPEVREAVQGFYEEFYDPEKIIRWWAGLYDPDLGGFYYANSARDNDGYLPDMESTLQIVQRLRTFDSDLARYLGPDITAKMIKFYQDKQDPDDGYFYHPQWSKAVSRKNVMRYTRDQNWAIAVLGWLHSAPLYPTALDRAKGSADVVDVTVRRLASEAGLTPPTERIDVTVKPLQAASWQPNETSVRNYVNNLMNTTSCEHWSNQLETQLSTFQAAGCLGYVLDVLDERVNPDYGLWVKGYNASTDRYTNLAGNSETPYGIYTCTYKVMNCYNAGNRLFRYSTKMVENAFKAINSRDPGARITYLFNPWATLGQVNTNLKNYGTTAKRNEYDQLINDNFLEIIASLKSTLGKYRCADGSYGFLQSGSSPTIYDTPVSLGLKEGDVNATNLVISFSQHICNAIGLSSTIPVFSQNHGKLMKELLDNAPKIDKSAVSTSGVSFDFESDAVGSTPTGTADSRTSGTTFKVAKDPTDSSNKVLEIKKDTEGNDGGGNLTVPTMSVPKMNNDSSLEIKMRINVTSATRYGNSISGSNPNIMQIRMMSDAAPFWMPTLRFNDDASGYTLVAGKNTGSTLVETINSSVTFAFDRWYEFDFVLTIKNFGQSNAEFKVTIKVDGEDYGTSYCFYADDYSSLTSGT